MALAAAQVVDAVAARLNGLALTGTRVYTSRTWPLAEADLPAWRVVAADEQVKLAEMDGLNLHRLAIEARGVARAVEDLDDSLHALAAQALAALFVAPAPYRLELQGIERNMRQEGEAAVGQITLRLQASFYAYPHTPETITD